MAAVRESGSAMEDQDERRPAIECICEGKLGKLINFFPFIFVMGFSNTHPQAALWVSTAISILVMGVNYYRSTYNVKVPALSVLDLTQSVTLLTQAIVHACIDYDKNVIGAITVSAIAGVMVLSLLVCRPFTLQFSVPMVSETIAKSRSFMLVNYAITMYWAIILSVVTACSWVSYLCIDRDDAWRSVLSTWIPTCLPIVAALGQPMFIAYLKSRAKQGQAVERESLVEPLV